MKSFFNSKILYTALAFTLLILLYSFYHRLIHVDDGILAEPTYFLLNDGVMRSDAFRGWWQGEEKFIFTHKLYLYMGALFISIFGWSAAAVKSVSLFYTVLLVGTWAFAFKYLKLSKDYFLLFALLLLTNGHIYEFSFVYRPEIAVAFNGSLCLLFLNRYLKNLRWSDLLIAGLAASMAIGNHLNGVIIPGGGCLLLLYHRRFLPFFIFGTVAATGFLFYLLGVHSTTDFTLMVNQFKHAQDIGSEHSSVLHYLFNLIDEQRRYLHSPKEIGFTLLFASSIYFARKTIWKDYRNTAIFTFGACFFLALIAHGKTSKYLNIVIPLITFLTVIGLVELLKKRPRIAVGLLFIFFVTQWMSNVDYTFTKDTTGHDYEELAGHLPAGTDFLTPENAVFWGVPKYRLQGFISYQFKEAHNHFAFTHEALGEALDTYSIDAVIFDPSNWKRYKMTEDALPKFQLTKSVGMYKLFERKSKIVNEN